MGFLSFPIFSTQTEDIGRSIRVLTFIKRQTPLYVALVLSLVAMSISPQDDDFRLVSLAIGSVGLLLIPGYYVARLIKNKESSIWVSIDWITLSFILGFAMQMVNVLILYSTVSLFYALNFKLTILFMTIIECIGIELASSSKAMRATSEPQKTFKRDLKSLPAIVFVSAFVLHLIYGQFVSGFTTDGSLYLEQARALVLNGSFTSDTINDGSVYPFASMLGFNLHAGAYFAIAVFFAIGGVSLFSAKFMTAFSGALMVALVYWLTYYFSRNKPAAVFASILAMFHPFLIIMSSLVQGPEIVSAMFVLTSFFFVLLYIEKREVTLIVVSGALLFLAGISWVQDFYIFLLFIPLAVIISQVVYKKGKLRTGMYEAILWGLCSVYVVISIRVNMYPSIFLLLAGSLMAVTLFLRRLSRTSWKLAGEILLFPSMIFALYVIYFIRSYAYPQVFLETAPIIGDRLTTIIPNLTSLFSSMLVNYANLLNLYSGEPIIYATLLTLPLIITNHKLLLPITFIAVYFVSPVYSFPSFTFADGFRFFVVPVGLIIITAGSFLGLLAKGTGQLAEKVVSKSWHRAKRFRGVTGSTYVIVFSVMVLMIAPSFATAYPSYLSVVDNQLYIRNTAGWTDEMVNWVSSHSVPSSVFACRKPLELAWLTHVKAVGSWIEGQPKYEFGLQDVVDLVHRFNVTYLIVDYPLIDSSPELMSLYYSKNIPGFDLLFENTANNKRVLIYNVSIFQGHRLVYANRIINSFDSLGGLQVRYDSTNNVSRGSLSMDFEDRMEGSASLEVLGSVLPANGVYVADFVFQLPEPVDLSSCDISKFYVKSNVSASQMSNSSIQFLDPNGAYRVYGIGWDNVGEWRNLTINLNSYISQSLPQPDLSNITQIAFQFSSMEPFSIRLDRLAVSGYSLEPP